MKRIGNLFEKICETDNLIKAIENATRGKRNRRFYKKVYDERELWAIKLQRELVNKTIKLNEPYTFTLVQKNGKVREISKPHLYPDHILHWAVMQILEPIFMKRFYKYSCGNQPGKGVHYAKKYVDKIMKTNPKYILKMDIHHFYPSINHDCLKALLSDKFKDKELLWVLGLIIDYGGDGLPIGFYSSQLLANFYLDNLDRFIKSDLRVKYYVRYVDDMVIFLNNKRKLHKIREAIELYLKSLKLDLKPNYAVFRTNSRPLDFLGFKWINNIVLLRNSIYRSLIRSLSVIKRKGYCTIRRARGITSFLGWCKYTWCKKTYLEKVKPIISKRKVANIISKFDAKRSMIRC